MSDVPPSYPGPPSSLPAYPAPTGGPQAPVVPRPSLVTTAFWLVLAGAAVQLVSGIVTIFEIPTAMRLAKSVTSRLGTQHLTEAEIHAAVLLGIAVAEVLALAIIVLLVVSAFGIRRGSGWARVLLTVVAVISLLNVTKVFGMIVAALLVVATIFVWLSASTSWFRAVKARRRGV
jgi:hypothetical protein